MYSDKENKFTGYQTCLHVHLTVIGTYLCMYPQAFWRPFKFGRWGYGDFLSWYLIDGSDLTQRDVIAAYKAMSRYFIVLKDTVGFEALNIAVELL